MIVLLSKVLQNITINIHIWGCIKIAILHSKKLLYLLYYPIYNTLNILIFIFPYNTIK